MQTEQFVSWMPQPAEAEVLKRIKSAEEAQTAISETTPIHGAINPDYVGFNARQIAQLDEARKFLLDDPELGAIIQTRFGGSLRDRKVVIASFWKTQAEDADKLGITNAGWADFDEAYYDCQVGGTTIRDKSVKVPKTVDGRPRIILKTTAFDSKRSIRLALFHEMLHAVNISGYEYKPDLPLLGVTKVTRTQTDLTYLPEYRAFARKLDLYRWDESIPAILTSIFLISFLWTSVLFIRSLRLRAYAQ